MRSGRPFPVWLLAVAVLLAVGWYVLAGSGFAGSVGSGDVVADIPEAGSTAQVDPSLSESQYSGLDPITTAELPVEALETLSLVADGGPFPFDRDDTTFQNREGLLPDQDRGYYREYTVVTPGESDRGARRIVAGADGDLYYTDDHYSSFREIVGVQR